MKVNESETRCEVQRREAGKRPVFSVKTRQRVGFRGKSSGEALTSGCIFPF